MTEAEFKNMMEAILLAIGKLVDRTTTKDSPSSIYDEIVKIRQAVENKVVVSSK